MKKKSRKLIMLLCALILLLAIGTGGYTYAKYRTAVNGGGSAQVAKWAFKVGNNTEEIQNIQLVNTVESSSLVNGKIAPGTSGQFFINIDGTGSEVGIDYTVKFANETNKPTNLVFTYGGQTYKSLSDLNENIKGTISVNNEVRTRKIQIMWQWAYETGSTAEITQNDKTDTQEGTTPENYTFDIIVTGTQSRI